DSIVNDNLVDFGRLDEPLQEELISAVIESDQAKESIRDQSSIECLPPAQIEENAKAVQENFSMHAYGNKLIGIYQDLMSGIREAITENNFENFSTNFLDQMSKGDIGPHSIEV
ncbi:MAG: hypothetical protein HOO00_06405, partial [Rhodospirillaceae bacterium]|nr:hypothetical protein [Rhodospirillaceae bacterium]